MGNNTKERDTEVFKEEVFELVGNEYTVIGEYVNTSTHIQMKHNKCGHKYPVTPTHFLGDKTRCPKCSHRSYKKTTEEFKQEVFELVGNEYIVIGEYKKNSVHIQMKHNCGHEYPVTPKNFLKGRRCPECSNRERNTSRDVKKLEQILKDFGFEYEREIAFDECKFINQIRFDFYIESLNLIIEYDGQQHFKPWNGCGGDDGMEGFLNSRKRDAYKNSWCEEHLISLLRIDHTNSKNLKTIVEEFLINNSSTTIEKYNLFYINEDSTIIRDNNKYYTE